MVVVVAGASEVAVGTGSLFGNAMMLGTALLWSTYTSYNKTLVDEITPVAATFFGILTALPVLTVIGAFYHPTLEWGQLNQWVWVAIFFSGGLAVGLAFILWNQAVRTVGASSTAVYYNLVPFVALLGGAVFLGEPITLAQIGGGLILGGLLLVRQSRHPPASPSPDVAKQTFSPLRWKPKTNGPYHPPSY